MDTPKPFLIIITGPTAVGKTDLVINLAKKFNTAIIGCDSRQFYKELKIGTAPPSPEQLQEIEHHFIHFISIHDYYNVSKYENDVLSLLKKIFQQRQAVFLTGGSGLYVDAVCNGIDDMPDVDMELRENLNQQMQDNGIEWLRNQLYKLDIETYKRIDLSNKNRILRAVEVCLQTGRPYSSFLKRTGRERPFRILKIALDLPREELYERINRRVEIMMKQGLEEEALQFKDYRKLVALKTVGYKELFDYFDGKISKEEAIDLIQRNTRKYARKQLTWFRRNNDYKWFNPKDYEAIINFIEQKVK